jgi:hypothetical protein
MTETLDRQAQHRRSITVTSVASLGGVAAGVLSAVVATGPNDTLGLAILLGATLLELGIMRALGVDVSDFSTKDHLYVAFMTFSLWFVSWGVILTSAV